MRSNSILPRALLGATAAIAIAMAPAAWATVFNGTLYYTNFTGGLNVNKVDYSYDDVAMSFVLSNQANVAATNGADGIIFAPNGNLLIGGQGSGNVYEVDPNSGAVVNAQNTGAAAFHLALDPAGNKVYTSSFGGALKTVNIPIGSGASTTGISGSESGITDLSFAPNGNVFYINGSPNGFGNVGLIDIGTGATSRIFTGIRPAHGMHYDSYTGLMTMFGAGSVGTLDILGSATSLKQKHGIWSDFDQGAVDGLGHALIAGGSAITFIDYRASGDITNPDFFVSIGGFGGIDDVAPLSGLGSGGPVPEPPVLALLGIGLLGAALARRRS